MNYLKINNFKCFNDISVPMNKLTVLAGANGNGKSTIIQALLFFRQTIEEYTKIYEGYYALERGIEGKISLNTKFMLALGNTAYLTNRQSNSTDILLEMSHAEIAEKIGIDYNVDISAERLFLTAKTQGFSTATVPILKQTFYYLNAERIGPRVSQSVRFYDFPNTGYQGENTAQVISDLDNITVFKVEPERIHPSRELPRLEAQVNAWLEEIIPGVSITAKQSIETLTAQIQVENYYTKGSPTIATNIGFGISYVLPIIVTGLIAQKDSFMIIENPEAHLHPSAQSKMGRFLAMVANAGVNVLVETHSDHLLNGIQIACAKKEIAPEKVTVNFLSQEDNSSQPHIESITINERGELSKWPRGFFDQSQTDYAELFKIRKG